MEETRTEQYDALILGAGPAGISAALYLLRAGCTVRLISRDHGALAKAHRIENFYGLEQPISGDELARRGERQAEALGGEIIRGELAAVSWDGSFTLQAAGRTLNAPVLIIAAGAARRSPQIAGMQELEGHGVSRCAVCDAFFFRGQTVALLGSGDFARHELAELLPLAGKVLWLTDGAPPEPDAPPNVEQIETPLQELLAGTSPLGQPCLRGLRLADGRELECAALFLAQDTPDSSDLARRLGLPFADGRIEAAADMSTSVPGLFAAGDCCSATRQVAVAVGQGAIAGLSAIAFLRQRKKQAQVGDND